MIISFPGGAGGNWLNSVINNANITDQNLVNFHQTTSTDKPTISSIVHSLDINEFDYLYSGTSYFNFYLNVMFKLFYHELNLFKSSTYETAFLECVNTARYICKFDSIQNHIFFNFNDLVNHNDQFLNQVHVAQRKYNGSLTDERQFEKLRFLFLSTMINPSKIYKNFDNMLWVCFVLGQLMNYDIDLPTFTIGDIANQDKCRQFAFENYKHCRLTDVYYFDTDNFFPEVL
jgi:hypothetical protein